MVIFEDVVVIVNIYSTGQLLDIVDFLELLCEQRIITYPTPSPNPLVHTPDLLGVMRR